MRGPSDWYSQGKPCLQDQGTLYLESILSHVVHESRAWPAGSATDNSGHIPRKWYQTQRSEMREEASVISVCLHFAWPNSGQSLKFMDEVIWGDIQYPPEQNLYYWGTMKSMRNRDEIKREMEKGMGSIEWCIAELQIWNDCKTYKQCIKLRYMKKNTNIHV